MKSWQIYRADSRTSTYGEATVSIATGYYSVEIWCFPSILSGFYLKAFSVCSNFLVVPSRQTREMLRHFNTFLQSVFTDYLWLGLYLTNVLDKGFLKVSVANFAVFNHPVTRLVKTYRVQFRILQTKHWRGGGGTSGPT